MTATTCDDCKGKLVAIPGPMKSLSTIWRTTLCPVHAAAPALIEVAKYLVMLDARLRLRSPSNNAEIGMWAQLRKDARTALAEAGGKP